jgi:AhpD family alkylhydroperoxidase
MSTSQNAATAETVAPPSRMANPVMLVPGSMEALQELHKSIIKARVSIELELVNLRASQINGCGVCTDMHAKALREHGESEERVWSVAAWRESPYFTARERTALALTEALTRIADVPDPVGDALWAECQEHFDETQLSGLILSISAINVWNRTNVATRQQAGQSW